MEEGAASIGRFRLLRQLGEGGMAAVWLAEMQGLEGFSKQVAVKVVHPHLARFPEFTRSFISEARLGGLLSHPNIVETLDFGEQNGRLYLAMEYVNGWTLRQLTDGLASRRMPLEVALAIMVEVLQGLHHAHTAADRQGHPLRMVHRDLKPSNILLSQHGQVKIADFGVARAESNLAHTQMSGLIKGTVRYMSPEQAWGRRDIDHRSDLFAAGVVLHELLTGTFLYTGSSPELLLRQAQDADLGHRLAQLPDLPLRLELHRFLSSALAREPAARPSSAAAMAGFLDDLLTQLPRPARLKSWVGTLQPPAEVAAKPSSTDLDETTRSSTGPVELRTPPRSTPQIVQAAPLSAPLSARPRRPDPVAAPASKEAAAPPPPATAPGRPAPNAALASEAAASPPAPRTPAPERPDPNVTPRSEPAASPPAPGIAAPGRPDPAVSPVSELAALPSRSAIAAPAQPPEPDRLDRSPAGVHSRQDASRGQSPVPDRVRRTPSAGTVPPAPSTALSEIVTTLVTFGLFLALAVGGSVWVGQWGTPTTDRASGVTVAGGLEASHSGTASATDPRLAGGEQASPAPSSPAPTVSTTSDSLNADVPVPASGNPASARGASSRGDYGSPDVSGPGIHQASAEQVKRLPLREANPVPPGPGGTSAGGVASKAQMPGSAPAPGTAEPVEAAAVPQDGSTPTGTKTSEPVAERQGGATASAGESSSSNPVQSLRKARELEKAGKLQEALTEYTRVAELDPSSREAAEAIIRLKGTAAASPTAPGELYINSYPYGIVYIDGEKYGYNPVHLEKATPRRYLIRVVNPDLGSCTTEVTVKPGETKRVHLRLDDAENCQRGGP